MYKVSETSESLDDFNIYRTP